eukprot:550995_1
MGQYLSSYTTINAKYPIKTVSKATKSTDNQNNSNTDKLSILPNIQCEVLINAYILQIEKELDPNTIIPETIIALCLHYYDNEELMYLINVRCKNYNHNEHKLSAMNMADDQIWPCELHSLFPNQNVPNLNSFVSPQYFQKRNVRLPPSIAYQVNINYERDFYDRYTDGYTIKNVFDIVFVSESKASVALIIDTAQNYRAYNSLIAFPWILKQQPMPYNRGSGASNQCTASAFSNKYGLIEFREFGGKTTAHYLRLDAYDDDVINWNWQKMEVNITDHHISTIAMLEGNDKLVALGGNFPMEIYDFNSGKWNALAKPNLFPSTCCYDMVLDVLYVSNCINKVDCYDFVKDIWIELPNTNNSYYENAAMWKQYNLLYIATSLSNPIEFIDVRQKKKWQMCEAAKNQTYSAVKYIVGQ